MRKIKNVFLGPVPLHVGFTVRGSREKARRRWEKMSSRTAQRNFAEQFERGKLNLQVTFYRRKTFFGANNSLLNY